MDDGDTNLSRGDMLEEREEPPLVGVEFEEPATNLGNNNGKQGAEINTMKS